MHNVDATFDDYGRTARRMLSMGLRVHHDLSGLQSIQGFLPLPCFGRRADLVLLHSNEFLKFVSRFRSKIAAVW